MKARILLAAACAAFASLPAHAQAADPPPAEPAKEDIVRVALDTDAGRIVLALDRGRAPITTATVPASLGPQPSTFRPMAKSAPMKKVCDQPPSKYEALMEEARRWLGGLVLSGVGLAVVAVQGGLLKDYQVDRFLAFTNPDLDPRGAGYNTEQARIAIGNGGVFGTGYMKGTQNHYLFLPEQQSDFPFPVFAEDWGFIGGVRVPARGGNSITRAA